MVSEGQRHRAYLANLKENSYRRFDPYPVRQVLVRGYMQETPEKIEDKSSEKPEAQLPDDQDFPLGKACDLSNEEGCEACQ